MTKHLEPGDDGTLDVSWHDLHRVLLLLDYRNVPNREPGIITYWNEGLNVGLAIQKEDRYNVDYFHTLLRYLNLNPSTFITIAFSNR